MAPGYAGCTLASDGYANVYYQIVNLNKKTCWLTGSISFGGQAGVCEVYRNAGIWQVLVQTPATNGGGQRCAIRCW